MSKPKAPKKKIGRPKLAVPKPKVLYLRLTDEENDRYQAALERSGLRRLADWARVALNRASEQQV